MKKIMIAAAIVCVAVISQAASFSWKTGGTGTNQVFWDNGSAKNLHATTASAVVYLFDATVVSQDALLTYLRANRSNKISDKTSVATSGLTDASKLTAVNNISYGLAGNDYTFYMAVLDAEGNIFLSSSVVAAGQASSTTDISFSGVKGATQTSFTAFKSKTFEAGGAGWYAVPEPTSGLLMLLGMAGLALKRKHA